MTIEIVFKHDFKGKKININGKLNYFAYQIKDDFLKEYASGIKTGKMYGNHRASAPNETPARITGRLGNSLQTRVAKNELSIVDTSGYGAYLEFGTKNIEKRQGIMKSINRNKEKFKNDLSRINK